MTAVSVIVIDYTRHVAHGLHGFQVMHHGAELEARLGGLGEPGGLLDHVRPAVVELKEDLEQVQRQGHLIDKACHMHNNILINKRKNSHYQNVTTFVDTYYLHTNT